LVRYIIAFSVILLSGCSPKFQPVKSQSLHYDVRTSVADSLTRLSISPYKNRLDGEMKTVIAYSDSSLSREGVESTLANFVMQSMRHFAENQKPSLAGKCVYIVNRGGLRNNLPQGAITKENIFEVMPFDNEIAYLAIKGDKLMECIKAISSNGKLLSTGLSFTIARHEASAIKVLNAPLDPNGTYCVVTSDYLAQGGDNCTFFANPVSYELGTYKLRDAIIEYCQYLSKSNQHIKPYKDVRINLSK